MEKNGKARSRNKFDQDRHILYFFIHDLLPFIEERTGKSVLSDNDLPYYALKKQEPHHIVRDGACKSFFASPYGKDNYKFSMSINMLDKGYSDSYQSQGILFQGSNGKWVIGYCSPLEMLDTSQKLPDATFQEGFRRLNYDKNGGQTFVCFIP